MKRWLARMILRYSVTSDRPLPEWVRALVQSDPRVADEWAEMQSLSNRLTDQANTWAASATSPEDDARAEKMLQTLTRVAAQEIDATGESAKNSSAPRRTDVIRLHSRPVAIAAAVCVILLAFGWGWKTVGLRQQQDPMPEHRLTQRSSVDVRPVLVTLQAGEEVYRKVSLRSKSLWNKLAMSTKHVVIEKPAQEAELARKELRATSRNVEHGLRRLASPLVAPTTNAPSP